MWDEVFSYKTRECVVACVVVFVFVLVEEWE